MIHAVGPRMGEGDEDAKLASATLNSLKLADENQLASIAFPAISAGIFGYPMERCAPLMLRVVKEYCAGNTGIKLVIFLLYGQDAFSEFKKALKNNL